MGRGFGNRAPLGLRTLHATGTLGALGDSRLIERFLDLEGFDREDAFSALVQRHGPSVAGVCRRMLANQADADDAFQAVFLVLARKAGSLRRVDDLGPWLRGVAVRVSKESRRRSARLRRREGGALADPPTAVVDPDLFESRALLDEELQRLPRRYREPLRLCELEGSTRRDAARRLGIPEGTLSTRLARGRVMLRDRLTRRGVAVGAMGAMFPEAAQAASLGGLADASTRLALRFVARDAGAGTIPTAVASLAEGVLQMIHAAKLKSVLLASSALVAACLTAGLAWGFVSGDAPRAPDAEPSPKAEARADDAKPEPIALRGVVVDESGKPVAGAEVLADPYGFFEARGVADGDGVFAIPFPDRLMGRQPLLLARTPDGRKVGVSQSSAPLSEKAPPARIIVKPGREVVATVADEDGNPIADTVVEVAGGLAGFRGPIPVLAHETTGADGEANLLIPVDAEVAWIVGKKEERGLDFAEFGTYANPAAAVQGTPAAAIPETTALALGAPRVVRIKAVDEAGQPVAGVPFYPVTLTKLGRRVSLNYSSRALLETTDRDGVAVFNWLPESPDPLGFFPMDDDYAHRRAMVNPGEDFTTIRLDPTETIRGRVVQADGSPAAGVQVLAWGSGRGNSYGWGRARTAADGSYSMKVNANEGYAVWVEDEDRAAPARLDVIVRPGQPVDGLDFQLGPGTLIHGTITADSEGSPAPHVHVYFHESGGEVPEDLREEDRRRGIGRQLIAKADDRGRYAIRVGPGVYKVTMTTGVSLGKSETITVGTEADLVHDIHAQITEPLKRVVLAGKVVDPDGRAVSGATVGILIRHDLRAYTVPVRTSADGRFEFEWAPHQGYIYAKSLDGSLGAVVAVGPEAADVVVPLAPAASIRGFLLDEMGAPVAHGRLNLQLAYPLNEGERRIPGLTRVQDFMTDAEGRFEARGLVVGQDYPIYFDTESNRSILVGEARAQAPETLDLGTLQIGGRDFEKDSPRVGDIAPELPEATTYYEAPVKLADYRGKFILLHFAGSWSMNAAPGLQAVYDAFRDDDRLVILNHFSWPVDSDVWEYQLMHGLPWSSALRWNLCEAGGNPLGVRSLPCFILIGPDGGILARGMADERLKQVVDRALAKSP